MAEKRQTDSGRGTFLDFLDEVGVGGVLSHPSASGFVDGLADLPFSDLHVDSLALMEIAIGLEERYGVVLSPNELGRFSTVGELWQNVSGR
jgi:hypothetical protein